MKKNTKPFKVLSVGVCVHLQFIKRNSSKIEIILIALSQIKNFATFLPTAPLLSGDLLTFAQNIRFMGKKLAVYNFFAEDIIVYTYFLRKGKIL